MLLSEDYARCTECTNPWFKPTTIYTVAKCSTFDEPILLREQVQLECTKCGHIQYKTDEEI